MFDLWEGMRPQPGITLALQLVAAGFNDSPTTLGGALEDFTGPKSRPFVVAGGGTFACQWGSL
jgi:hypothetical protein